jgi:NAD(P)-dependent dehydrogenase (short-subunit alcohol dehydrogenase family)
MPTALIIGASRGLGFALAEELWKREWDVIATVRAVSALKARERLRVEMLDMTDWRTVESFATRLKNIQLDLLFVNAGVLRERDTPIGKVEPNTFSEIMLTNAYAPLRLIDTLDGNAALGATIAVMSSGLGSIARNETGGWEIYRMSKAALAMGLRSLEARATAPRTWLAVTPGWVQTDMGGDEAPLMIEESIPPLVDMLEARHQTGGVHFVTHQNTAMEW